MTDSRPRRVIRSKRSRSFLFKRIRICPLLFLLLLIPAAFVVFPILTTGRRQSPRTI